MTFKAGDVFFITKRDGLFIIEFNYSGGLYLSDYLHIIELYDTGAKIEGLASRETCQSALNDGGIEYIGNVYSHSGCSHDWKQYVGVTDCFYYCLKCDEKDRKHV